MLFVVGGKAEQCVDVSEWLVLRGACNVVIALWSKSVSNQVTRRIDLLRSYHNAHIVLMSTSAASTITSAANLLQEATSATGGRLAAMFILPVVSFCLCCWVQQHAHINQCNCTSCAMDQEVHHQPLDMEIWAVFVSSPCDTGTIFSAWVYGY